MSRCTCRWCGKTYDSSNASRGGVRSPGSYCSIRCENAGRNNEKKEASARKEFWSAHPILKILKNIAICLFVLILIAYI